MAPDRFDLPIDFESWSAERQVAFFLEERALNQFNRQSKVTPAKRAELKRETVYCTNCGEKHSSGEDCLNFCRACGQPL